MRFKFIAALSLALLVSGMVSAQSDYVLFLSESLTPKQGHATQLENGVKAHNEKFHTEGEDKAYLFSVLTGPRSGQYVWIQGPMSYGSMDNPRTEEHAKDWDSNVAAHCDEPGIIAFMRRNDELSYNPANEVVANNYIARVFHGVSDQAALLEALGMVKKVYEAKEWTSARRVYTSDFRNQEDESVALVYPFEKFADLEKFRGIPSENLEADFESVHGAGSFEKFVETIQSSCDGWYDEVRVMVN